MGVLLAGFPHSVAAVTLNRLCASGLNAVNMAARAIKAGEGEVYIAGGVESMSRGPYAVPKSATGWPVGNVTAWDTSFGWRFPNPKLEAMFPLEAMGETAENIYEQVEPRITREEQDAFAYESQRRAVEAINTGRFRPRSPRCRSRSARATPSWSSTTSIPATTGKTARPSWKRPRNSLPN
jgi:acetyl-CoA acetyltransferase